MKVYYDGLCPVCSREINHYRKIDRNHCIDFVDITSDEFDPQQEGLNLAEVHKVFHVKSGQGEVFKGLPAFVEIWKQLNCFTFLTFLAENKYSRPVMNFGYQIFAQYIRPKITRADCSTGYCKMKELA